MSSHKHIDRICAMAAAAAVLLCILLLCLPKADSGCAEGISMGYEDRLFDPSRVHSLNIIMDDWDGFISTAENEEYSLCSVEIDGELLSNVGIRGKGNTSLSNVSSMGSSRYSFKIEFDCYDSSLSYHGLDKLSLNNLIQDSTGMKDYLSYRMMNAFGVDAPLCSYVYISVNGQDWGLYLAVEGVEDAFLQRSKGNDPGQLYKPDSLSMGAGRGKGKDFSMEHPEQDAASPQSPPKLGGDFGGAAAQGSSGSSDVLLQYIDDEPSSYPNIFDNAKTDVSDGDRRRLISSLKALSEGDVESCLDIDAVLRYFVVHNYLVNGDSYTGSMIHNYYLYEQDGLLSMIPWDYNLAFGTFMGGSAEAAVNDPIDAPLSVSGQGRPMIDWIFASEEYSLAYRELFAQFLSQVDQAAMIDEAFGLISPYMQLDPSAFYSFEEFLTGVEALRQFCALRNESIALQLAGEEAAVDCGGLELSHMGSMGGMSGMSPDGDMQMPQGGTAPGGDMQRPQQGGSVPDGSAEMPQADIVPDGPGGFALCLVLLAAAMLFALRFRRRKS